MVNVTDFDHVPIKLSIEKNEILNDVMVNPMDFDHIRV